MDVVIGDDYSLIAFGEKLKSRMALGSGDHSKKLAKTDDNTSAVIGGLMSEHLCRTPRAKQVSGLG